MLRVQARRPPELARAGPDRGPAATPARRLLARRGPGEGVLKHLLLTAVGVPFVIPLLWMVATSLMDNRQIYAFPPELLPDPVRWDNYPRALVFVPFLTYLRNTLIICVNTVIGAVLSSAVVAYGFSRFRWRGRGLLFALLLSTMMLPYQVTMIPVFLVFNRLDWVGTIKPLIAPAFFAPAFYVFLLRQFFVTIPQELSDAARIDGCSEGGILVRVILPLARPALATVALFQFIHAWNDFLGPLIYLNEREQYTISIGLQQFQGQYSTEWGMLMAASAVTVAPIIVLFFLAQRTFIQGIALTGIKG